MIALQLIHFYFLHIFCTLPLMELVKRTIRLAGGEKKAPEKKPLEENFAHFCIAVKMNYAFMGLDVSKTVINRRIKYAE